MKNSITVLTPGTIDADYRGNKRIINEEDFEITNGTRIAQMVLCPISKAKLLVEDLIVQQEETEALVHGSNGEMQTF